ncbi:MMPL family transporter [bacterium]|nr:MMPL family transporter [bacterium]
MPTQIRKKLEKVFSAYGWFLIKARWGVIAVLLVCIAFLSSHLKDLVIDTSTEGFLHRNDPILAEYNAYREQFGRDEMIIVMIHPKEIFNIEFLKKLNNLHKDLEANVPNLDDITSLVNARLTRSEGNSLVVGELMETIPKTPEEMESFKQIVLNHPLYRNLLISESGEFTAITLKTEVFSSVSGYEGDELDSFQNPDISLGIESRRNYLTHEENTLLLNKVKEIIAKYHSSEFPIYLSGSPVINAYLKKTMKENMGLFSGVAVLIISIFLLLLFRRLTGVILPILTVGLSVIATMGSMAWFGFAIKLPTMILPSFLLAVGIGASVHLIAVFYKNLSAGSKHEAIVLALSHSGLPITMTALTTAAGLLSFSTADVAPIADLGIFSAIGILISLILSLTLIPALLAILPVQPLKQKRKSKKANDVIDGILLTLGQIATRHSKKVIGFSSVILVITAIGLLDLKISHNILQWFPETSAIRQNTNMIDDNLRGSITFKVLVNTPQENGLYDPNLLKGLEKVAKKATEYQHDSVGQLVHKTISLSDIIKEINQALHGEKPEYYSIPDNRNLIAQEFLLFENSGSDDLEDIVDSRFSKTHLTVKLPWVDTRSVVEIVHGLKRYAAQVFGDQAEVRITGLIYIMMSTMFAMINSTVVSYLIAAVVITLLMILLIGDIKLGLLSMIPNLFPIIMTLGLMGWLGIALDMFTLLIGSIAIGLAADDTIHFFHHFRGYYQQTGCLTTAVSETLLTAGKAMLVTTLVLVGGFWVMMFADLINIYRFGFFTGVTLLFAFLADVLIAPALLTAVLPKDIKVTVTNAISTLETP